MAGNSIKLAPDEATAENRVKKILSVMDLVIRF